MIEQMKNKNEFRNNGNLYVKKIKSCTCLVKSDDRYIITCNIHQRGNYDYAFCKSDKWITKSNSRSKLWLSDDAEATVCRAVEQFEDRLDRLQTDRNREIKLEDAGLSVIYGEFAGKLDCVIKYNDDRTKQTVTELHMGTSLEKILHHLQFLQNLCDCHGKELLQNPTWDNIMMHPFIVAARKDGDFLTELKVKIFYRLADADDCKLLTKVTGKRILPPLPKEYDREYCVDAATFTNESYEVISRSGYQILHRAYFGMNGFSHSKISLNPYTKIGVDAAKTDAESISFDDFLGIYDSYENECVRSET